MHRLKHLGRKFDGTGGYEFANYDQPKPQVLVYLHDIAFVKNQVYRVIIASADAHGYRKERVISFLIHYQKLGVTPDDTFVHSPYLESLFNNFIEGLVDELKLNQLGGMPFDLAK